MQKVKAMFESLQQKLQTDPVVFQPAIMSFVSNFEKMSTKSAIVSSLFTYGKYSGASAITAKRLLLNARKCLQTSTKIGVQPTAVARRKTPLEGRRALITGRPTKHNMAEHAYSKRRLSGGTRGILPPKKKSVPHSLSHCVSEKILLGRTHSAK